MEMKQFKNILENFGGDKTQNCRNIAETSAVADDRFPESDFTNPQREKNFKVKREFHLCTRRTFRLG